MHGLAVTTIEGIGSTRTKLHAVQVNLILIGLICGRGGTECTDNDICVGTGHATLARLFQPKVGAGN